MFVKKKTAPISSILDFQSNQRNWSSNDNYSLAHIGYINNVIAHRCIKMIATSVASVPIIMKCNETSHINSNHQLLQVLRRPNSQHSVFDLLEHIVSHYLIFGNAFLLKITLADSLREIHILNSENVKLLYNKHNDHCGYSYAMGQCNERKYHIDIDTGDCEVLHIKNFHPLQCSHGLSTVEAAMFAIDQHNQASEWNQSLLRNGARPSGAMIVKHGENSTGVLSEVQFERIKQQIDELHTGTKNSGKPLLLEGGLEWKEMSISPKDMDFVNMKNSAARDIALAFGVPPQILGIPGDNTYSNLSEARIALWEQTILPMLDLILHHLSCWLLPTDEKKCENFHLTYNRDQITQLSAKREKMWEIIKDCDFMTDDEKRSFFGLDPLEG